MRKALYLIVCLVFLAALIGCESTPKAPGVSDVPPTGMATEAPTQLPTATPAVSSTTTPIAAVTETPVTSTPSPSVSAGAELYSSYAHIVSFDPAKGIGSFDYFDILRGDDAVIWLVEHEGYSQSDAENEVADYADSEFVEKNTNPQLREINLQNVPITLMFDPDTGDMLEPAAPLHGTLIDLYNLYELDHSLVTDSFFYWIEVKNGEVESVEQVYWP